MMKNNRSHEELVNILDRVIAWINNCDAKASTILGIVGVILGILLATDYTSNFIEIYSRMLVNISLWSVLFLFFWSISVFGFLLGCFFLILVLISHTQVDEFSNRAVFEDSVIFFGSISNNASLDMYKEKIKQMNFSDFDDDYISQIYICSIICQNKFRNYRKGLILIIINIALYSLLAIIGNVVI